MYRRAKHAEQITLEYIDAKFESYDAKFDKHMEQWRQDRKEMEARIAADRKETADRLAADRKEAEARQQATETRLTNERREAEARQQATETRLTNERREAEARQQATETRLMDERKQFITQKRFLIANLVAIVVGMGSIFIALLIAIVVIVNGGLTV